MASPLFTLTNVASAIQTPWRKLRNLRVTSPFCRRSPPWSLRHAHLMRINQYILVDLIMTKELGWGMGKYDYYLISHLCEIVKEPHYVLVKYLSDLSDNVVLYTVHHEIGYVLREGVAIRKNIHFLKILPVVY